MSDPFTEVNERIIRDIAKLEPDEEGIYKVPIGWRYSLENKVILDTLLKARGFEYIKRPPSVDYELWRKINSKAVNPNTSPTVINNVLISSGS